MNIIVINCGHGAVMNGAEGPAQKFYDLARLADSYPHVGHHYGDDRIEVRDEDLPLIVELLEESCLLYRIQGRPLQGDWLGIKYGSEYQKQYAPEMKEPK